MDARGKIIFGSTVELYEEESEKEIVYRIVGEDEADIGAGLISYTSPIARALIGKNEGDVVPSRPDGEKHFEVIEVRYDISVGGLRTALSGFSLGFSRYNRATLPMRCTSVASPWAHSFR